MSGQPTDSQAEEPPPGPRPRSIWARRLRALDAMVLGTMGLSVAALYIGWQPLPGVDAQGLPLPQGFAMRWLGFLLEMVAAAALLGSATGLVLACTAACRRRFRAAMAMGTAAILLGLPDHIVGPPVPATGPTLRVATVNLLAGNEQDPALVDAIRDLDADVLAFPEFTPLWRRRLAAELGDQYPHRAEAARPDPFGIALWSRVPFTADPEVQSVCFEGRFQIRTQVRWQERDLAIYAVHPKKPFPPWSWPQAARDRAALLHWLGQETLPAIVAGDFNATPQSPFLHRLEDLGFTNGSTAVAGSRLATWPRNHWWSDLMGVTIDHVLHSGHLQAHRAVRGADTWSDHAPLAVDLSWR